MSSPEPHRSYRRYVSLGPKVEMGDLCRYAMPPAPSTHPLCRTSGCKCDCHKWRC